ncbi:MAG: hypothetical protein QM702_04755 [Rubrivivax sp.]
MSCLGGDKVVAEAILARLDAGDGRGKPECDPRLREMTEEAGRRAERTRESGS